MILDPVRRAIIESIRTSANLLGNTDIDRFRADTLNRIADSFAIDGSYWNLRTDLVGLHEITFKSLHPHLFELVCLADTNERAIRQFAKMHGILVDRIQPND